MESVEKVLKENLECNDVRFIFPSEITASFWRKKSLEISGIKAVLSDRFISWDRFKEDFFSLNQRGIPVNSIIRNLFAVSLLEENKTGNGFFKYIIPSRYRANSGSFRKLLVSILPELPRIEADLSKGKLRIPEDMAFDLDYLGKRYSDFLIKGGFFEPGWMNADISGLDGTYYLFFPEVITDYGKFSHDLSGIDGFRVVSVNSGSLNREIVKFPSSVAELKWILNKIDILLGKGVSPKDIVITAADMDGWREKLKREAALRSIPLSVHGGLPLSSYPGAAFFKSIQRCFSSGFSAGAVKQLLLDGALPWKESFPASGLVSFGIEYNCFVNYRSKGKEIDIWAEKLGKRGKTDLLESYRQIRKHISAINTASGFAELKREIQKFIAVFLDTDRWNGTDILREFQFALDSLNSVHDAAERCPELKVSSPFDFWISVMDEKIYVPKDSGGGIPVYPYRVAGGINTRWHFISGFSQRMSSVVEDAYPFLREDQKKGISSSKNDFTNDFLSLFSLSGENVVFSMSSDSFSGPEIPPVDFVGRNAVVSHDSLQDEIQDAYDRELLFWKGNLKAPGKITEVMAEGMENASVTILSGKRIDYTGTCTESVLLKDAFAGQAFNESGILEAHPTMLDAFYFCPYAFFLKFILNLEDRRFSMDFRDHMLIGNIIHRVFKKLFSFINESTDIFDPSSIDLYREKSFRIVDSIFYGYEKEGLDMLGPVWDETRNFIKRHIDEFLSVESDKFPRFRMESAEQEFSVQLEYDIRLKGKVDRISVSADGDRRCLIDYKKNFSLSLNSLNPEEGYPSSFQLFFYMFLAESSGLDIHYASYYNFTKDKYVDLFSDEGGRKVLTREEMNMRIDEMLSLIVDMRKRIAEGDFKVESCSSCDLRNICRKKYTVR